MSAADDQPKKPAFDGEMSNVYAKIAETGKGMVDNMDGIVQKTPLKIFVG